MSEDLFKIEMKRSPLGSAGGMQVTAFSGGKHDGPCIQIGLESATGWAHVQMVASEVHELSRVLNAWVTVHIPEDAMPANPFSNIFDHGTVPDAERYSALKRLAQIGPIEIGKDYICAWNPEHTVEIWRMSSPTLDAAVDAMDAAFRRPTA